ncbi:MAG TPA: porin [Thermoanaerobaculia bacterium]|nr:porin [Thermoanaerobaculia bacterium]
MKSALAAILCSLLASASAFAQDDPVEARLRRLEDEVASLKKENEQLRRDLGLEVVARQADIKMAGRSEAVQLGGLIQAQTDAGDRGDSRFSDANSRVFLRRARMNVSGRFLEEFNFRAELEFAGSLANATGFGAQLTDAYVNWNRFDSANVRVGQFKTPFGFEQLYADPRLYTAERTLVSDRLAPGRQIGIQVGGEAYYERFNYALGLFNGSGTNQNFNDNNKFMAAARVSVVPFSGRLLDEQSRWSLGADGFRTTDASLALPAEFGVDSTPATPARDNIFVGRRRGVGYDTQFELGPFELWAEYLRATFEAADRVPAARLRSDGWYAQASYYVIEDKLQLVARREVFDPSVIGIDTMTRSSVFGVNWYFKQHDLKLQVDWMRGHVPGTDKQQQKLIARLQSAF